MKLVKTSIAVAVMLLLATAVFAQSTVVLRINNNTVFSVNIYIDDIFVGVISPYSYSFARVPYGSHVVYATAPGTSITWGPSVIYDQGIYT
jgi:hypothetical protein